MDGGGVKSSKMKVLKVDTSKRVSLNPLVGDEIDGLGAP